MQNDRFYGVAVNDLDEFGLLGDKKEIKRKRREHLFSKFRDRTVAIPPGVTQISITIGKHLVRQIGFAVRFYDRASHSLGTVKCNNDTIMTGFLPLPQGAKYVTCFGAEAEYEFK